MSKIKRWIAQLFNIRPEDLVKPHRQQEEPISRVLQAEIAAQVQAQLRQILQEDLFPQIRQAIAEQPQAMVTQPARPVEMEPEPTIEIPRPETPIVAFQVTEGTVFEPAIPGGPDEVNQLISSRLETEFPVIEEIASPAPIVETTPDEILPVETELLTPVELAPAPVRLRPVEGFGLRMGIDFGTSTTSVSIKIGDDLPEVLNIGKDGVTPYIPSIVYLAPGTSPQDERVIVGEEAEDYDDQTRVIRSVKRCLGCQSRNCLQDQPSKGSTRKLSTWCQGDGKIHIDAGEILLPEKVAYYIIHEALDRAIRIIQQRRQLDLHKDNLHLIPLNIGCGAKFDYKRREILRTIAQSLGFVNISIENIVEEPILAGYVFSRLDDAPHGQSLIYDFGGGTFDVAVIDIDRTDRGRRVTVLSTAGENWLGGDDIDTLVYNYFLEQVSRERGINPGEFENDLDTLERINLRRRARIAKEQLSTVGEYSDDLFSPQHGLLHIKITRDQFEDLLKKSGLVEQSLNAAERACRLVYVYTSARENVLVDMDKINKYRLAAAAQTLQRVILVGGITKIPYIRNRLAGIFGTDKLVSSSVVEPISAVSVGGVYPLEPDHYSVCSPPYGFYMEYTQSGRARSYRELLQPYEFYEFNKNWAQNAFPEYKKSFDLLDDCSGVKIYARKVGEKKPDFIGDIGNMQAGPWFISIGLEGDIHMQPIGGRWIALQKHPLVHPIQQAITNARQARARKPIDDIRGDINDWMKGTMNEN